MCSPAFWWLSPGVLQKTWSQMLFCIAVAGVVSGCSDAQETDSGLPSDPVAYELMQRKAEEAGKAFVSTDGVLIDSSQRSAAVSGAAAVASLHDAPSFPGVGGTGLPDSFRLLTRHAADASARAAHAAADAMGIPEAPQSRLDSDASAQEAESRPARPAEDAEENAADESKASVAAEPVVETVASGESPESVSVGAAVAVEPEQTGVIVRPDSSGSVPFGVTPIAATAAAQSLSAAEGSSSMPSSDGSRNNAATLQAASTDSPGD